VTSLWADERVYYPVDVEPYTPAHHFPKGKADPQFRTKLKIAVELVLRAVQAHLPSKAPHADVPMRSAATGEKNQRGTCDAAPGVLASRAAGGTRVAGAVDHAAALLERLVVTAPTSCIAAPAELA